MNIDERLQALTMNLELLSHEVEAMRVKAEKDGENIATLARLMSDQYQMIGGLTATTDRLAATTDRLGTRVDQLGARMEQLGTRMDQLGTRMEQLAQTVEETSLVVKQHNLSIWDIAETNKMLARIISKHEDRIDALEMKNGSS